MPERRRPFLRAEGGAVAPTTGATRRHPLPSASRCRAVPRRQGPAGARPPRKPTAGRCHVDRRGAEGRGIDLLRRARRSAPQPADRAGLQGFGSLRGALEVRRAGSALTRARLDLACGRCVGRDDPRLLPKGPVPEHGRRLQEDPRSRSRPGPTGAAVRLRQDRAGRVRPRARAHGRRAGLDRRHRARRSREAGIRVRDVSDVTGFPGDHGRARQDAASRACMAGCWRCATIRSTPGHAASTASSRSTWWSSTSIRSRQCAASGADYATIVENIDIGGPAMMRAAAKNHAYVAVVTDPDDYAALLNALELNTGSLTLRIPPEACRQGLCPHRRL